MNTLQHEEFTKGAVGAVHIDTLRMINDPSYAWPVIDGAKIWPPSKAKHDEAYQALYTRDQHAEIDELRRHIDQLKGEIEALKRSAADDSNAARLYRVLERNASEQLFNPKAARCEIMPDMRTCWKLPTMICSGPIGGYVSFADAVDYLPGGANDGTELG